LKTFFFYPITPRNPDTLVWNQKSAEDPEGHSLPAGLGKTDLSSVPEKKTKEKPTNEQPGPGQLGQPVRTGHSGTYPKDRPTAPQLFPFFFYTWVIYILG